MGAYSKVLVSSVTESLLFTAACSVVAFVGSLAIRVPFFDGLGFVLLVVSSGLMLIGGALSFITPAKAKVISQLTGRKLETTDADARASQHRAALYATTGVILFAESLLLASLTLSGV